MSLWWSLHLRREAASVPLARRLLLDTMETAGVDPDISFELSVALTEACANAVEHGGTRDRPQDAYRVTAYLDGEMCRIEVADSGPGFPLATIERPTTRGYVPDVVDTSDADPDYAEHGRGLGLIEEIADHVWFANRDGAVVSFDKILKWRTDSPLVTV
ncbi:ATP-binding protein [Streptomyces sp. TRM66268-LWL]|uniref:ATP-binding protein n=1 Tax=Streptomyces polyasparticus TaxID=2767826 RepID=A0ABR7SIE9_9ACTN|nr:ATP-binding protein [Streptomyces polyasparticus]MBC9714128.1 ATP-binding protein [Streptomyces polyasparticus]